MSIDKICSWGQEVVEIEAAMIHSIRSRIDQNFAEACQLLHQCKGRIIVIGIGKSGHIGKKIVATLASTGSPAFFVHPSEAKHGDIGMLTKDDVIIALSYSGESEEIIVLLPAIRHLQIPIISITGKPESTLAQAGRYHLDVSVAKEACPLGLAPTASSTAMLVMGDALAMTLLRLKGFTHEDFARSHPGGALGKRLLLQVAHLMHAATHMPSVSTHATLKEALIEMTAKKLGATLIVDTDTKCLEGIFTDGDLRRALDQHLNDLEKMPITHIMTKKPKTILQTELAIEALKIMKSLAITILVVINEHQEPVGVLHIHDILRAGVSL